MEDPIFVYTGAMLSAEYDGLLRDEIIRRFGAVSLQVGYQGELLYPPHWPVWILTNGLLQAGTMF